MSNPTDLSILSKGNQAFIQLMETKYPGLLEKLAYEGQHPPFFFLGCSDSRVSEGTVFSALPGTLFTERNIANQFLSNDNNIQSALAYAVSALGVTHVIVMGHYGCGGVAAAMSPRPEAPIDVATSSVQNWVEPIRHLSQISERPELVQNRQTTREFDPLDIEYDAFRALVEENIKVNVQRVFNSAIIQNHYALLSGLKAGPAPEPHPVFIHGLVYDLASGSIFNLNVSRGPPGVDIPKVPFPIAPDA